MSSIQGLGSMSGMSGMSGMMGSMKELTDDQKKQVAEILSKYDPDNITEEDAKAIFKELADAGIRPTKGLKEAIEAAGFDAEELRSLGMPQDGPPPPPPPDKQSGIQSLDASSLKLLQSILDQYDFSNLTDEQEQSLIEQLSNSGLLQSGDILNIGA